MQLSKLTSHGIRGMVVSVQTTDTTLLEINQLSLQEEAALSDT